MSQSDNKGDPACGGDGLCRRCGRCCCAKLIINGDVVYTPYFCKYLDATSRLCTIYERRFEINPDCMPVDEGIRCGVFPADCPYVQNIRGYRPPRECWTAQERALFENVVRRMKNVAANLPGAAKTGKPRREMPIEGATK